MSYRCGVCQATVAHGQPLRRHTTYRSVLGPNGPRQEIAKEVAVCEGCDNALNGLGKSPVAVIIAKQLYVERAPVSKSLKARRVF